MKIQIVSDLHLEFHHKNWDFALSIIDEINSVDADMLVLAGDIFVYSDPVDLDDLFPRPYIFVPGNHEYYYSSIDFYSEKYDKFVATTGWSDGSGGQFFNVKELNDFNLIQGLKSSGDMLHLGKRSLDFIKDNTKEGDIVITHHAPSLQSISERYRGSYLNPLFANNWEPEIKELKPKLWIHGHVHQSFDYFIGETRVVCNPAGYPRVDNTLENKNFNPKLVVEI